MHKAKLFLSLKIVQRRMLNMFRGQLLNFEVLIIRDKNVFYNNAFTISSVRGRMLFWDQATALLFFIISIFSCCEVPSFQSFAQIISHFHNIHSWIQYDCISETHRGYLFYQIMVLYNPHSQQSCIVGNIILILYNRILKQESLHIT